MGGFSIGAAIGEAFGLMRRRPAAMLVWGALMVLPIVLAFALTVPALLAMAANMPDMATAVPDPTAETAMTQAMMAEIMKVQGWSSLLQIVQWLGMAVVYTAVMRAIVRPDERSWFSLRVGMDELRVAVIGVVIGVGFFVAFLVVMLAVAILGFAAGAANEAIGAAVVGLLAIGVIVAAVLALGLVSPMAPASVLYRDFAFDKGWRMGRENFGRLAGMLVLVVLILIAIEIVLFALFGGLFLISGGVASFTQFGQMIDADPVAAFSGVWSANWPWAVLAAVIACVFYGVAMVLTIAPFASAVKQMAAPGAALGRHDSSKAMDAI